VLGGWHGFLDFSHITSTVSTPSFAHLATGGYYESIRDGVRAKD
jgi:hypothetical protein